MHLFVRPFFILPCTVRCTKVKREPWQPQPWNPVSSPTRIIPISYYRAVGIGLRGIYHFYSIPSTVHNKTRTVHLVPFCYEFFQSSIVICSVLERNRVNLVNNYIHYNSSPNQSDQFRPTESMGCWKDLLVSHDLPHFLALKFYRLAYRTTQLFFYKPRHPLKLSIFLLRRTYLDSSNHTCAVSFDSFSIHHLYSPTSNHRRTIN